MITLNTWLAGIVAFGAGLSLLQAVSAWLDRDRTSPHVWFVSCLFICLALFLARGALELSGNLARHAGFWVMQFSWSYLIGPLLYLWLRSTIQGAYQPGGRSVALMFGGLPFAALDLYILAQPETHAEYLNTCLVSRLGGESSIDYFTLSGWAALAVYATNAAFSVGTLVTLRGLWSGASMPASVRLLWIFLAGALLALPLLLLGDLFVWPRATHLGLIAITMMLAVQHLARLRDPQLVPELRRTTRRKSYERSALQNVDAEAALERLRQLMEEDRLYLDEELSLEGLAEELRMSRHQLSGLLNEKAGKNFHAFLNEYRVAAACAMLRDEPQRSVLSIAHAAGFNSKSSFHSAFQKFTGVTPLQYRARNSREAPA